MEERAKRKLTAILSADVKGYSRLMGEDDVATIRTLEEYRELMSDLINQHRGRVVDSPGDNLLAEFASVVDAVESAVEIQKELKTKNAELPENRRMDFRIGINLGDVVEEGERIYGDGVNLAARIEGLADGGGISISRKAFQEVKNKLSLGYEYQGKHTVKNIAEPVRVYRVLVDPSYAGKVIGEEAPKTEKWRWAAIAMALIIIAGALALWNFYFRAPPIEPASVEKMAYPLPENPSIAVLPFDNMSGDPAQDYLADGISENIIDALSRISRLFVIARNSTFTYKGQPVKVQQVSEELGVRYVLEGSVQRSGSHLRITAQLIDAIKGNHIWSEKYDRKLNNLFALQDEVTKQIVTALNVKLTQGEQARLAAKGTDNLEAYLKFMQAREYTIRHNIESNASAQQLAQEAIGLDPNYASAYRVLGVTHMHDIFLGRSKSPKKSLGKAIELVKKAIELDDQNGYNHVVLGFMLVLIRQYDKAVSEGERGVALDPNVADIYGWLGTIYRYVGRWEDAITAYEKAIRLNPISPIFYLYGLGLAYAWTERYEEAIIVLKKAIRIEPDSPYVHLFAAAVYSMAGRDEEARKEGAELLRLNPKFSLQKWGKSLKFKNQDDQERLITALRKAGLPETPPLPLPDKPSIAVLPFTNMSGDPEQEYFSDGITEDIITGLSKTPKIFVIARTSSSKYKGKEADIRTIARELGVRYVLEGSVQKSDDKVRITAQLIDAKTNQPLWAERYDRKLKDIFEIHDEITMKIITAMQVRLTEGEQARLLSKGTDNLEAYLLYLQAADQNQRMNKDSNVLSRQLAEKAIALDSKYAAAYRILAHTYWMELRLRLTKNPKQSMARAMELAQKSLALDKSSGLTYGLLGWLHTLARQYDKGISECERGVSLEPGSAMNHLWLGQALRYAGRHEEAATMYKEAIRLNPIPGAHYYHVLSITYSLLGQYEQAITLGKKAIRVEPNNLSSHIYLAVAYSLSGQEEEARIEVKKVLRINPKYCIRPGKGLYKNPADMERIRNALRKSGLPDCPSRRRNK